MKRIINESGVLKLEGTQMGVEVILASRAPGTSAPPIYTIRMRYPRIIHAELMTHRVFSRNARSSRAVPVSRMIEEVRHSPFVPWHWGKNQKGMQAAKECNELIPIEGLDDLTREEAWHWMSQYSADTAEAFSQAGYHKQICNRLLEPFMWIDTLVTSTDWENFLWLRDHADAEPHLIDLARMVKQAIATSEIQDLQPGEWHLPYITQEDWEGVLGLISVEPGARATTFQVHPLLKKISAARCARISYAPFDGDASYERELDRYDSLLSSDRIHASPLEHQATPDRQGYWADSANFISERDGDWDRPELHGNFRGWIQYRKTVPGEAVW